MSGRRLHLIGIGGSGMSALAVVLAAAGDRVSGSDRDLDRGEATGLFQALRRQGIALTPQDGSGVRDAELDAVVISGAVEESVSDVREARARAIPVRHRAEMLAEILHAGRGIAVAGTSGKSTVAAMIAWVLRASGRTPTFVGGAPLARRPGGGEGTAPAPGAWAGSSGLVVVEADESDASLARYRPELAVLTNLSFDHRPLPELRDLFRRFGAAAAALLVRNADRPTLDDIRPGAGARLLTFGTCSSAEVRGEAVDLSAAGSCFRVAGTEFRLQLPGRFNVENALAALAVLRFLEVPDRYSADALAAFPGVARRMERVGAAGGVLVLDDFAHNPDKVAAALEAARVAAPGRMRVVFQLHGFGPARMHRAGLVEAFAAALCPEDRLYLPPIYFAGGTVRRDVSAEDYAADLRRRGVEARAVPRDGGLPLRVAEDCQSGDVVMVMGARDPSLPVLAEAILGCLGARGGRGSHLLDIVDDS